MLAFLAPLSAGAAQPESHSYNHIKGLRFDAHGTFGGYGSLGAGVRIDIPFLPRGIIAGTDDELALSPGLGVFFTDFYPGYDDGGATFVPSGVLQWNFDLGRAWSVFPEVGVAIHAGRRDSLRLDRTMYLVRDPGIGVRYHFSERNALLVRASTPLGLQLGSTV